MITITNFTDGIERKYADGLTNAQTREELIEHIEKFGHLAEDALEIAKTHDFTEIKKAIYKERKGEFCGKIEFLPLIMPTNMFKVSMACEQFKVPFGLAYHRLLQWGEI